ncbi:MAG: hypothetical protein J6B29_01320 [Clostridia bacterium]|nr:hypothetical protein [Clostridia bacterium]
MKVIILSKNEIKEIIEHFISYGQNDFIVFEEGKSVFGDEDYTYYRLNGVNVVSIQAFPFEGAFSKLSKIKGSINGRLAVVYSSAICDYDIDSLLIFHNSHQGIATLVEEKEKRIISSVIFEQEVLDYFHLGNNLEREILKRIGQDCEMEIYRQKRND